MKTTKHTPAQAASTPGRRTLIAALLAGLSAPAFAASPVVISQVYGAGGNTGATIKNDFIELFNRSDAPVSLAGWSVQYASAGGASWQVTKIAGNPVLQPGQYYLVQEAAGTGGSVALVPDTTGTISMGASTGKVALVSNSTSLTSDKPSSPALMDLLGYGAGYYEGSVGPSLSSTSAALRANGGCTDTDNNGTDFITGTPNPRNTASPLQACNVPVTPPIVASCPANLALAFGAAGSADLSATDVDGIVNNAVITSAAVPGISLYNFTAASGAGASATVSLQVAANVARGSYPVVVRFDNDQAQKTSCTINVNVAAPAGITLSIPQIQGAGENSPVPNSVQTTEGVVTAKVGSGFFIQDPVGDNNAQTSDGIFVYTTAANTGTVQVGDLVRVTGTVVDYVASAGSHPYTELQNISAIVKIASGRTIAPTNIQLPYANLGQLEGMLVRITNKLTVSQLEYLGSHGQMTLSVGRLEVPTNRYSPGSTAAKELAQANLANQIVLDDGVFVAPTTIPFLGEEGTLRAGNSVSDLTGVIDFGAKGGGGVAFKLQPTAAPVFSQDYPRSAPPVLVAGNIKVASANVLNYFTTFTNGQDVTGNSGQGCLLGTKIDKANCRGADNLLEFQRQSAKIVGELQAIDADVFGLMEIQNSGETTVKYLVKALNEAISPGTGFQTYALVPAPASTGTDAIRVAMIYKPAKLSLYGSALSDADAVNNRPPMAQTFKANNGAKFSLIVNHLKSKGSCPSGGGVDGDKGDGQSCWNATRVKQANRLVTTFAPQVASAAGDAKVLLIGDFNAYGKEDPIKAITDTGYVNQLERFVRAGGDMPYSFVFNGEAGYLDHALASAALTPAVVDAAEWHNNADEPTVIDYNTDGKSEDKYTAAPYRASDHDPVVISLNLAGSFSDVSASVKAVGTGLVFNRVTGKYSSTFSVTNTGSVALNGPFQVEFSGLPAGITLSNATGSHAGAPIITVNAATLAPGATVSFPLIFNKTGTANIGYTTKVYSGNF